MRKPFFKAVVAGMASVAMIAGMSACGRSANNADSDSDAVKTIDSSKATWTRKISCYLCCFFGGCHWFPRRMKYQERPYNSTLLHSREAGREQTKTSQHIPFRFFIPRCRFRCILRFQKNAMHIGPDRFCRINCHALSFLHRGGFVSRRCICSFNGDDARAPWPCNPP